MLGDTKDRGYSTYLDSRTKRCFDIAICLVMLVPAMVIVGLASLSIIVWDGRPVFFIHRRAGKKGKLFWLPKLRTLRADADPYQPSSGCDNGSLVTVTGKFLRRHRLDELPQLFSVLVGHMSLVGPRPELPNVVVTYKPLHKERLRAKPGITGLWQIIGNRKAAMHQDMKYDLYYLHKASLWLDVKILAGTVLFIFNPKCDKGTYEDWIYTDNVSLSV